MRAQLNIGCKGLFKLEATRVKVGKNGKPILDWNGDYIVLGKRDLTGWFSNKLLNNGKNRMGTASDWLNCCQVGTDGTTPTKTDTGLLGYVAGTSNDQETISGAQSTPPYYAYKRIRYRFDLGATAANLNEVGIGWATTDTSALLSRALIVDANGDPTTVTPLADEILDVWYEFRFYPPLADATGTAVFDGTTYNYTCRASEVTLSEYGQRIGNVIGEYSPGSGAGVDWIAYDGTIGDLTQAPNGVSYNGDTDPYNDAYSNNSYQRRMVASQGPNGWNVPTGIRSVRIKTNAGRFQTEFDAVVGGSTIPKTNQYTMIMAWIISWTGLNITSNWNMIAASDSTTPVSGEWNTNVAGTTLRIAWENVDAESNRVNMRVESGSVFRITDTTDSTKWVEYTANGAYTEFASWTEFPVTQTGINNSGPTVGNECIIENVSL